MAANSVKWEQEGIARLPFPMRHGVRKPMCPAAAIALLRGSTVGDGRRTAGRPKPDYQQQDKYHYCSYGNALEEIDEEKIQSH